LIDADSALNDIRLICVGGDVAETFTAPYDGSTVGNWGSNNYYCPMDTAVCGIRTLVEPYQGKKKLGLTGIIGMGNYCLGSASGQDDTAVNDVELKCCDLPKVTDISCLGDQNRVELEDGPGLHKAIQPTVT